MTLKKFHLTLLISSLFAIAMAYLESSVVVYLRELYYPGGFSFPLREMPLSIMITEIGREAATIIMLYTYAHTAGRNGREIFGYFSIIFGIWDIWYYIWLKVLIDWPASLFDWDILFLIPAPWVGPVLAPVIVSLALIGAGYVILHFEIRHKPLLLRPADWLLEVVAGLVIIYSFLTDSDSFAGFKLPKTYSWWIFCLGLTGGLVVFMRRVIKNRRISEVR